MLTLHRQTFSQGQEIWPLPNKSRLVQEPPVPRGSVLSQEALEAIFWDGIRGKCLSLGQPWIGSLCVFM